MSKRKRITRDFSNSPSRASRGMLQEVMSLRVLVIFIVGSVLLFDVGRYTYTTIEHTIVDGLSQWLFAELKVGKTTVDNWLGEKNDAFKTIINSEESIVVAEALEGDLEKARKDLLDAESAGGKAYQNLQQRLQEAGYHSPFIINKEGDLILNDLPEFIFSAQRDSMYALFRRVRQEGLKTSRPIWLKLEKGSEAAYVTAGLVEIRSGNNRREVEKVVIGGVLPIAPGLGAILNQATGEYITASIYDNERRLLSQRGPSGTSHILPTIPCGPGITPNMDPVLVLDSYANFRGTRVVASCRWFPDNDFGIIIEVPVERAFLSLRTVTWAFALLFFLLLVVSFGALVGSLLIVMVNSKTRRAMLHMQKLGQYTLERRIGKGGMGEVYVARHAMLRRPVALKLIRSDRVSDEVLDQFEKEVQLTSQLTHPNTIAIYDYGRTPEKIFYYVMEFLDGINIKHLLVKEKELPEGRVIHILDQICGSLAEAHRTGLIHRDIKPANIMLCRLGGMHDVVKVLDFGLIKKVSDRSNESIVAGTVRVMAPEVVNNPGSETPQSDIFSIGVLGYFLLTGHYLYDAATPAEYLKKLLTYEPARPSARLGRPISSDLEQLIVSCLNKNPLLRPGSVKALQYSLRSCLAAGSWTEAHAAGWWEKQNIFLTLDEALESPDEHSVTVDPSIR